MTISSDELQRTFESVGEAYGFDSVSTEFAPFKEFKNTWRRDGRMVSFEISDYLTSCDSATLQDFSHSIYKRVTKQGNNIFTDRLSQWMQSPEFIRLNQPIYIKRSRNISNSSRGSQYDLKEAYLSLMEDGLVNDAGNAILSWTKSRNHMRMGYCSVIMKVIAVTSALDDPSIPDFVHRYVLYHELIHLERGLQTEGHHNSSFRRRERMFPRWSEAEGYLKRLASRRS